MIHTKGASSRLRLNLASELLAKIFKYFVTDDTLIDKVLAQSLDHFHLLFRGKTGDGCFDDTAH